MEERKRREYFNTRVNRYVRDHATNITANPNPGNKYQPIKLLAQAVIYQALLDARSASYNRTEVVRWFSGEDFKYYAEMAGINESGKYTLWQFRESMRYAPSLDRLIDG